MNEALWLILVLSAPPILAASLVGLVVSIFLSATQLQEQTTQYAFKFGAIALTLALMAPMLSKELFSFGTRIFTDFPSMIHP